jgi:flagellar biosynthetic protein FliP
MFIRLTNTATTRSIVIAACALLVSVVVLPAAPAVGQNGSANATSTTATRSPSAFTKAATTSTGPSLGLSLPGGLGGPEQWASAEGLTSAIQVMLLLTVISLAPAILLMTTCFIRVIVVLGLLRQALGTQQLPPSQVITSISLFITILLMTPIWTRVYEQGIRPYTDKEIGLEEAFTRGVEPVRRFMADQIMRTENDDDVYLFLQYLPKQNDPVTGEPPKYVYYDAQEGETVIPLQALLPAFMLSELKTAFLIGFQVYLPFVILDIVVASVTISMGMLMLPPVLISLPFKLLLFVLVDGWHLVVGMLLESFHIL